MPKITDFRAAVQSALPHILEESRKRRELDENATGKDDKNGIALQYAADLLLSVMQRSDLPKPPKELL